MAFRALRKGLLLSLVLPLAAGAVLADHDGETPRTVEVNCSQGRTLSKALEKKQRPLIVEFTGTCDEEVTIPGDDITLRGGDPSATVTGTVTLVGRSRVTLEGFTVRDTPVDPPANAIVVRNGQDIRLTRMQVVNAGGVSLDLEGSWVDVTDSAVSGSREAAVEVALGSVVHVFGTLMVTGTGGNAVVVTDRGQLQISPGAHLASTDNAGAGLFAQLGGHVFVHGGSRLTSMRNGSGIGVVDLAGLVHGGAAVEVADNAGFGVLVGQLADWTAVAGFNSTLSVADNGGPGLLVIRQAFVRLIEGTTIAGNGGAGLVVDGAGVAIRNTTIEDNNAGAGDVVLVFTTNATFDGGNTVPTPIVCDGAVTIRGQFACGAPLTAAEASAISGAAGRSLERVTPAAH